MSKRYVDGLARDRDSLAAQRLALEETATKENRALTEAETTSMRNWTKKALDLDEEIRQWQKTTDAFASFTQVKADADEKREQSRSETTAPSLGQAFIDSKEYRGFHGYGHSGRFEFEARAPIDTLTSPGSLFMQPDRSFTPAMPTLNAPILGLSNQVQVSGGTVDYVIEGPVPEAGVVAENTPKPEAVLSATPGTAALQVVAHHKIISRQAAEDSPQLRSWVDGQLSKGVLRGLETLAAGALTGATLPTAAGADLLQAIRVGIATVQDNGFDANGVVLNPMDWASIDNAILAGTLNGPATNGSLWGVRLVASRHVAAGAAYVGDFASGLTFFYRNQTAVYVTDSHASLFLSNQLAVLAERRALSVVTQPDALCGVAATPSP